MRLLYAAALALMCAVYVAPEAYPQPAPQIPPVSDAAAAVGFVDVRTAVPDAVIDLRYATANNFVGAPLYPAGARCLIHESLAPGLAKAAEVLRAQGATLVFWDCYRPHSVQVRMFDVVSDPNWVAKPGPYSRSHESGRSVDVTLAGPQGPLDMGTDFDDFTPRANAFAPTESARLSNEPRTTAGGHGGRRLTGLFGRVVAFRRSGRGRATSDHRRPGGLGVRCSTSIRCGGSTPRSANAGCGRTASRSTSRSRARSPDSPKILGRMGISNANR